MFDKKKHSIDQMYTDSTIKRKSHSLVSFSAVLLFSLAKPGFILNSTSPHSVRKAFISRRSVLLLTDIQAYLHLELCFHKICLKYWISFYRCTELWVMW